MWQNNILNKRINEELPKDFSICDLDGCTRCFYNGGVRLIIYECKRIRESLSDTQLTTLRMLRDSIDWNYFDKESGVYIIRELTNNFDTFIVEDLNGLEVFTGDLKILHYWFSCKDKN